MWKQPCDKENDDSKNEEIEPIIEEYIQELYKLFATLFCWFF